MKIRKIGSNSVCAEYYQNSAITIEIKHVQKNNKISKEVIFLSKN